MCGVSGFIDRKGNSLVNKPDILEKLTDAVAHRGPDGDAMYMEGSVGLGMKRLAIIDLSKDLYPFFSADKKTVMFYNGEIYNYLELKKELKTLGMKFETKSDAEVIIRGYEKWGIDVITKLRGMFAIALWDGNLEKLFLIRDRIGIKPMYYVDNEKTFFFSSEVKSFFSLPRDLFDPKIHAENLTLLLGFMYLPNSAETILEGVKKVPPGCYLEVTKTNSKVTKYWDLNNICEDTSLSYSDAKEKLENMLNEVTSMHLMSDVPLGILLSGGLDSSLLTALISKNRLTGNTVNTFAARFDHKFNESHHAKKVAGELKTNHTEILIDPSHLNENIEDYVHLLDDLTTFDGGIFTTKFLCDEVRKYGIKVLLLGEGADEVFGGYSWFGLAQAPFSIMPGFITNSLYYYAISRNVGYKLPKFLKEWHQLYPSSKDKFRDITKREILLQLPNHLLMKVDKGSMSSSIEARVPYLDHKLVEYVYSLPREYKQKGFFYNHKEANEKHILREIASKYLPKDISTRKKRGFMLPMDDVLGMNKGKVRDYILSKDSISSDIFTRKGLENLFEKGSNKLLNMHREYMLWRLFLLEVWAKHYKVSL